MRKRITKLTVFIEIFFFSIFTGSVFGQQDTIKILAIGNSFSVDAVEHYLYNISAAKGIPILIGNANVGSCSLSMHWSYANNNSAVYNYTKIVKGVYSYSNGKTLSECIRDENWDYITLQQFSQNSGLIDTYFPYLTNLVQYVKSKALNPNVKLAMHMTWAYAANTTHDGFATYYNSDQMTMYKAIVSAVDSAAKKVGISIVIPAGTAIQNARNTSLGDNFCRDTYHLNNWGWYTVACTWVEKLFGVNTIGCPFVPTGTSPEITANNALLMQTAAHDALLHPKEVTPIVETPVESGLPKKSVNIDFGSTTSDKPWNNMANPTTGSISNLKNAAGENSGISITLSDPFNSSNLSGPTSTTTELLLPQSVSVDCFYGNAAGVWDSKTEVTGGFSIGGLKPDVKYTFSFFSSRTGVTDNRETQFTLTGQSQEIAYCDAANNTSAIAKIIDVVPSVQGTVEVSVTAGPNNSNSNKFFYINAMQILPQDTIGTHISEISEKYGGVNIYSNDGKLILSSLLNNLSYSIYNMIGQLLVTDKISTKNIEIPLKKGIYVVRINNFSKKIIM